MSNYKFPIIFVAIIILAALLRFYNLANNPPGLTWDEAALGYNAYSILETGRDEYGTFLPLNFKSFGDYKPGLYVYLDVPFVAMLGLNELAVRFPSALFGVIGVIGVMGLIWELFKNKWMALSAGLFFAISPWSIQFSRAAFEANIALTFNIFAVYFFVKGFVSKNWLLASALFFGLSLITYQSSRAFIPLLLLAFLIIYGKEFKVKNLIAPTVIIGIFMFTVGLTFLSGQTARLQTENYFAYTRSPENTHQISQEDGWPVDSPKFQILHGQWWEYAKGLVERYTIYFSPRTLFIDGDYSQRQKVPDLGLLYYFALILIPVGIWGLLAKSGESNSKIIWIWIILAPIPGVLSRDLITSLRTLNLAMPFAVFEGMGFYYLTKGLWGVGGIRRYLGVGVLCLMIAGNFVIYLDRYFIHAPKEYSEYWLYGYKQVLTGLNEVKNNYQKVTITDVYGQSYIYFLFYNKYPPADFQKQAVLDQPGIDVGTVRKIDNIEFRHIYWPNDRGSKNGLFIGSLDELPDKDILPFPEYKHLKDVNFLDGLPAFREVETK